MIGKITFVPVRYGMFWAKAGSRTAFVRVHGAYGQIVYCFLIGRGCSVPLADDLTQEVFLRWWKGRERYQAAATLKTYLLGIAKNVLREEQRRFLRQTRAESHLRRIAAAESAANEHRPLSQPAASYQQLRAAVEAAGRANLSPNEWDAWEWVAVQDLAPRDGARRAGCSRDAFRQRLHRARQKLLGSLPQNPLEGRF